MNAQLLFGVAVVPAIVGLTQVLKDLGMPSRFAPAAAVCFGVLGALAQVEAGHWAWIQAAVLGLSAVGLYAGTQTAVGALKSRSAQPAGLSQSDGEVTQAVKAMNQTPPATPTPAPTPAPTPDVPPTTPPAAA